MSLPRYIEVQRIERSKELLLYEDLSLEEVAALCQFDNQEQFRNAFRENTGLWPSYYKKLKKKRSEFSKEYKSESNEMGEVSKNENV